MCDFLHYLAYLFRNYLAHEGPGTKSGKLSVEGGKPEPQKILSLGVHSDQNSRHSDYKLSQILNAGDRPKRDEQVWLFTPSTRHKAVV
jgi:hypothetical protein